MIRTAGLRMACVGALVAASAVVFAGGAAFAGAPGGHTGYTCTGGAIPSGTYASITVAGPCSVAADAVIDVTGSVGVLRRSGPRRAERPGHDHRRPQRHGRAGVVGGTGLPTPTTRPTQDIPARRTPPDTPPSS